MGYITYAQRREWNTYYHETILPALREGSMDDVLEELNTEVRARREMVRAKMMRVNRASTTTGRKREPQEVKPREKTEHHRRTLKKTA